jgi:glucokinase
MTFDDNLQVLGIDLGGSAIKLGRFNATGQGLQFLTVATPQPATPAAVLPTIVAAISAVDPESQARAIGIGTPGPADATGRIARLAINLPDWIDVPLADRLEQQLGKPTIVENDANCAGLGEVWLGAGRSYRHLMLLTLGTGVGGAIFLNGQLFTGSQGAAGELGLITLHPDGAPCNSGNRGSLEQSLSAPAIRRQTGREPEVWGKLATTGDREALAFWQDYGRHLGIGLSSLIYVLTPEAILIGGGISGSAKWFLPAAQAEIEQRVRSPSRSGLKLICAELGNRAGMVGAAKLALKKCKEESVRGEG